jgi:hypothetical protein
VKAVSRTHVFADESGDFTFKRDNASRFFILTTVALDDCAPALGALNALRHELAWEGRDGRHHYGPFHANYDPNPVRNRVFDAIDGLDFRIDSIILEKSKAKPSIRKTAERFYQYAWYYLMRYLAGQLVSRSELLVVAASIGTNKKRSAFYDGVRDVLAQVSRIKYRTACWSADCDGCLQVADYAVGPFSAAGSGGIRGLTTALRKKSAPSTTSSHPERFIFTSGASADQLSPRGSARWRPCHQPCKRNHLTPRVCRLQRLTTSLEQPSGPPRCAVSW